MKFLAPGEYQPLVQSLYMEIADLLQRQMPHATIEHIGSSSIADCVSKGDLDIYVGVQAKELAACIPLIESLGFNIKQDTLRTDQLCPFEACWRNVDVGIQLVERGSKFDFFLTFRDLMNSCAALRSEYNQLKWDCQGLVPADYRARKSKFIERVLGNAGK